MAKIITLMSSNKLLKFSIYIMLSLLLGGTCFGQEEESIVLSDLKIHKESYLIDQMGDTIRYELGSIAVPENRQKAKTRTIRVGFLRFFAKSKPTVSPIFVLPGGPGNTIIGSFLNSKEEWRHFNRFESFLDYSDVVIVDQRGYSPFGEMLMATYKQPARPRNRPVTKSEEISQYKCFARNTVAKFTKKNIDLSGYSVIECSNDVYDLRKALNYNKITLYGASFGSQWSFAIMRLFPDMVERAVLSGVEPLNYGYDMPSHVFSAVQRKWEVIDKDPHFRPHLPKGGMAEASRVVLERLQEAPLVLNKSIVLGPEDFPWNQPALILWMYHKELEKLAVAWNRVSKKHKYQIPLIRPLIDIGLGVTPDRQEAIESDSANAFINQTNYAKQINSEGIWPSPKISDDFRNPIVCEIPVLFLQGDWDTSTPVENTYDIAPFFVNSHVLIVERGGHVVFDEIRNQFPSVWKQIGTFLRTGDVGKLPRTVRLKKHEEFVLPY